MHANFRVRSGNRAKFLPVRHRARGEYASILSLCLRHLYISSILYCRSVPVFSEAFPTLINKMW